MIVLDSFCLQVSFEGIVAGSGTLFHSGIEVTIAGCFGEMSDYDLECRDSTFFRESCHFDTGGFADFGDVVDESSHIPFARDGFQTLTKCMELSHFTHIHAEAPWITDAVSSSGFGAYAIVAADPAVIVAVIGEGMINKARRKSEFSCEVDFGVANKGDFEFVIIVHCSGPVIEFLGGRRRGRRTTAPRKRGKFRCRCWRLGGVRD